ncbi:MAG: hypothetical protein O9346_12180 [Leptospiraceae bacterium]|nr:hypothetical protein [Leptospiraceae bacterium]MCZ8347166.1 hypothetical protein [Leptospiraceae bacterium]
MKNIFKITILFVAMSGFTFACSTSPAAISNAARNGILEFDS